METRRTRNTRAGPASTAPEAARGPARSTRQRGASEEPTTSKRASTRPDSTKGGGSLAKNPVPRRGARPSVAASIASSIPTNPGQDDEEDEDDGEGSSAAVASSPAAAEDGDEQAAVHMLSSDRQFLMFNIVNLAKAAEVVIKRTRAAIDGGASEFQQRILALKLKAFRSLHDLYELPGAPSPFLSFAWTSNDDMSPEQKRAAEVALVLANLAVALDFIKVVTRESEAASIHGLLEVLVTIFPNLFIPGDNSAHSENEAMLAVQLRTNCLVESLHACKTKQEAYEATAAMFCAFGSKGSVSERIANGPFKKLARSANSAADNQLCSDRATSVIAHITRGKKGFGVPSLRKAYPLEDTLSSLQQWILAMYSQLGRDIAQSQSAWKEMHIRPDEFFDAEIEVSPSSDDSSSEEDEQPITRIQSNGESQVTLFRSKEDLRHLMPTGATPSPSRHKRTHSQANNQQEGDDDDEEDEDNFQTDYRELNQEQLAAAQEYKRQRIALGSPQQATISHTQLAPPSSGPTAVASSQPLTSPPSTAQDLRQLASLKQRVSKGHRAAQQQRNSQGPISIAGLQVRHRVPWSDADSLALMRLLGRGITYADMEYEHSGAFEHPRNQLAYRDRARNMKVDYLITDCVLPLGFDSVNLGGKEVMRVVSFGKNPNRRVQEVNADGTIYNNILVAELHAL